MPFQRWSVHQIANAMGSRAMRQPLDRVLECAAAQQRGVNTALLAAEVFFLSSPRRCALGALLLLVLHLQVAQHVDEGHEVVV